MLDMVLNTPLLLQVLLTITEVESVITWDFDVIDGDCVFQLLRHKRPREAGCLGENGITKMSVRPGVDAQLVERPIACNQGDSVQVRSKSVVCTSYCTVPSALWRIFPEFLIYFNVFHEPLGYWNKNKTGGTTEIFVIFEEAVVR